MFILWEHGGPMPRRRQAAAHPAAPPSAGDAARSKRARAATAGPPLVRDPRRDPARAGTAALDKAFDLLDRIAGATEPPTAAELASTAGLPRSTLHRMLAVLEQRGLIRRDARDRTWRPGFRLLEFAQAAWSGFDLRDSAEDELAALIDATGETVQLAVADGDTCVVVAGASGRQAIRHAATLGARSFWRDSAPGLALVAFGDPATRRALIDALPAAAREPAQAAVDLTRGRGYAIGPVADDGVADVAAPVLDYRGQAAAALSLAGPRFRLDDTRLNALAPVLMAAARRVSHNAGGTAMSLAPAPPPGAPTRGVRCVEAAGALLGEAPYWSPAEAALYWVDMLAPALHRFAPRRATLKESEAAATPAGEAPARFTAAARPAAASPLTGAAASWPLARLASAAVPRRRGGFVLAHPSGLFRYDGVDGDGTLLCHPEAGHADHRYNDAKCDARGRLWVGSLDPAGRPGRGSLFRVDADGRFARVDTGFTVANGIAFAPDGRRLYFADSGRRVVYAYDVDSATGAAGPRRAFASFADDVKPDGLAADADGGLWVAVWDGWRIERYDADGRCTRTVRLPVPRPTSLAFGGADLATLFVTTARVRLDPESLARAPLSGGLFAIDVDRPGAPVGLFGG